MAAVVGTETGIPIGEETGSDMPPADDAANEPQSGVQPLHVDATQGPGGGSTREEEADSPGTLETERRVVIVLPWFPGVFSTYPDVRVGHVQRFRS